MRTFRVTPGKTDYLQVWVFKTREEINKAYRTTYRASALTIANQPDAFYTNRGFPGFGVIALLAPASLETVAHEVYHLMCAHEWPDEERGAVTLGFFVQTIWSQLNPREKQPCSLPK